MKLATFLAMCFLFLTQNLNAQQSERELLGFKGGVSQVLMDDGRVLYEFDNDGQIKTFSLNYGFRYFKADITTRSDNAFAGEAGYDNVFDEIDAEWEGTYYKMYFANGRISRISTQMKFDMEYYFDTYTLNFSSEQTFIYNNKGEVTKVVSNQKMKCDELDELNTNVEKVEYCYQNYTYDKYGNWVSRDCYLDKTFQFAETRTIVYSPQFLSHDLYQKALAENDVDEMERLANDTENVDFEVRKKAAEYWNTHLAAEINGAYKYQWEKLFQLMTSPIINTENRTKIEKIIRQYVWEKRVVPETDYRKMMDLAELTYNGWHVFDAEYSRRIKERSQQMRTDSIARLYTKASGEYNAAQYERAIQTLRQLLLVDQYHENAYDLMVGAKYQLLQKSIKNNTVKESEFEDFLDKYSDSRYRSQVEDQFVTYRLQHLPDKCSYSDISELQAMPVNDKKLQKKVDRVVKRQTFIMNRGRCIGFGFGGSYEVGDGLMGGYGEIGFRIGYVPNLVNLYVGGRFGQVTSLEGAFLSDKYEGTDQVYFKLLRATVPVQLRLNFAKNYKRAWYLGLGAEVNFNIKARAIGCSNNKHLQLNYPDANPKEWVNKVTYTPRASLGVSRKHFNFEVYGAYDLQGNFKKDYLDAYDFSPYTKGYLYNAQLKNKWRGGVALRIFF